MHRLYAQWLWLFNDGNSGTAGLHSVHEDPFASTPEPVCSPVVFYNFRN